METEHAMAIIADTIKDLKQIKPRGIGIRAEHVKDLVVEDCKFVGLEKALDISESEDITWKRNIVNNYEKYSEFPALLEHFLTEAKKKEKQVNKGVLARIKNEILKRWPELAALTLVIAMERIIKS